MSDVFADYSGEVTPESTDALADLSRLGAELDRLQKRKEEAEARTTALQAAITNLAEVQIPELMDSLGLASFTTREGIPVTVKSQVHAHISKANRDAALRWLEENGHGGMIRRKVIVEFDKDQQDEANELVASLHSEYPMVDQDRNVHHSTLRAWAREQLESGEEVPQDLFGIHLRRIAKIG